MPIQCLAKIIMTKKIIKLPSIALYQPEIALNVGNIIRSCACFGLELHIIEPCGFPFDIQRIKKSALDYIDFVKIHRHNSFNAFYDHEIVKKNSRLILATTKTSNDYRTFKFLNNDIVIFGQESSGVPIEVSDLSFAKITIKMTNNARSLNIATSCAIIMAHFV